MSVITKKPILNKIYLYGGHFVKIKKIQKTFNKITLEKLDSGDEVVIPYLQSELLIIRIYTVGEVAKIVEKRTDTLRKYEKKGLLPEAKKFGDEYSAYKNWRYYTEEDVYDITSFFHNRVPGRPVQKNAQDKIKNIQKRIESDYVRK